MTSDNRRNQFRELLDRLSPIADVPSEFYVERRNSVAKAIATELELSRGSTHILIGGVGSGKTTELLAAHKRLQAIQDIASTFLDVTRAHDIAQFKPGVIAVQVGIALGALLNETLAKAPSSDLSEESREATGYLNNIAHGYFDPYGYEADDEPWGVVGGILVPPDQKPPDLQNIQRLIEQVVNGFQAHGLSAVVLLDGLDRLDNEAAFRQILDLDIAALRDIGLGLVISAPLRIQHGLERAHVDRFTRFHYQPWIDVDNDAAGVREIRNMLQLRVRGAFDDQALTANTHYSGGVIRDMLSIAQSACVQTYMEGLNIVGLYQVDTAIEEFARKHIQGLRREDEAILRRVLLGEFTPTGDEALALLMTRRILEYRQPNGRARYALHPTIVRYFKEPE